MALFLALPTNVGLEAIEALFLALPTNVGLEAIEALFQFRIVRAQKM